MSDSLSHDRRHFLGSAAVSLAAARFGSLGPVLQQAACAATSDAGELSSLRHATGWINSPPLTPSELQGRVVLIDFWTYTCINWIRSLPYVRAWADKYADQGLVVIGVHTPEFEFEKDVGNVRRAAQGQRVTYPVAIDNGRPPGAAHGIDIDDQGYGSATDQRLYQLIRQRAPIADRQLDIGFLDPGIQAFAFTFG